MKTSKKIRGILLWLLITVLSLYAIYVAIGSPVLTPEMGMRRAERNQLVGPSKRIGSVESVSEDYDHLLVGETEYGYCFYLYEDRYPTYGYGGLTYVEKDTRECFLTENVYGDGDMMPVFAIAQNPRAVSARLTLETECEEEPAYAGIYTAQAELTCGVFYQFAVDITGMDSMVSYFWAGRLRHDRWGNRFISGTATLELFDREGNLIETIVTEYPATK